MSQKPYLISGIIGNSRMLGCLDQEGQLARLFWPRVDYPQNINKVMAGVVFSQTGRPAWLNGPEWEHSQMYVEDANILRTTARHRDLSLNVVTEDFAHPEKDILVRGLTLYNYSTEERQIRFCYYSDLGLGEGQRYNTTVFDFDGEALVQYKRRSCFATGAERPVDGYQCGWSWDNACEASLNGNHHSMGSDGTLMWDLGTIAPGESKTLHLYTCCGENQEQVLDLLAAARTAGFAALREEAVVQAQEFLRRARPLNSGDLVKDQLYRRSLLVFSLLSDPDGGIVAAPEIDEDFTRCGGYAYCWPRDAAYITTAYDLAGLKTMARQFYQWVLGTKSGGPCQQRYYLDGSVAPNWGIQIDEIGSVLWGMWQHYLDSKDLDFARKIWSYVQAGVEFIHSFFDPETGLPKPCYDLWEERVGEHTYSAAAVWGGLTGAAELAGALGMSEEQRRWKSEADRLKQAVLNRMWDQGQNRFLRSIKIGVTADEFTWRTAQGEPGQMVLNRKGYPAYYRGLDQTADTSLLGLSVPFGLLPASDERMRRTAELIEAKLTALNVGGLLRYEGDSYIGGNPWIITTLWLALYHLELGNHAKASDLLDWAVRHRTPLGLLPEQVHKDTGEPAWVVPLTWSHAMFVLVALRLQAASAKEN